MGTAQDQDAGAHTQEPVRQCEMPQGTNVTYMSGPTLCLVLAASSPGVAAAVASTQVPWCTSAGPSSTRSFTCSLFLSISWAKFYNDKSSP